VADQQQQAFVRVIDPINRPDCASAFAPMTRCFDRCIGTFDR